MSLAALELTVSDASAYMSEMQGIVGGWVPIHQTESTYLSEENLGGDVTVCPGAELSVMDLNPGRQLQP